MSPERWQQIEEIFQDALDLPWSEREKFVAEKCGDDAELKSEVEKLLSQFEDASSFIETPALSDEKAGVLSSLMEFDEDDPMIGNILGSYRIEREIGRGGMGAVYEAIRADGEFRRKVAIKVVKRGMDTDFILRRFRNERQILATLEHPYITRLLDGGTTDDGRPYFVMDYIEGLPLYRYCDKKRLTIENRLKLFTKICEAVEYAHQNLVIHRDLKPSNILIASDGTPRLLDFGIAKLLNPEMASDTLQPTATAMRMMTIDYASPEQINGEKVTYSTDIYSLGVILFELLTGHRPYRFANRTPHEIARVICEESPILPSDAITRSEETLPIIHVEQEALTIRHLADLRKNSPDKLREILSGNLDNITLKALCKLPDDRYQSVKRFREDIEKHLEGKPLSTPFNFPAAKSEPFQNNAKTKLIAVLPLKLLNFSANENTDENYLSIGLADAIISRLTNMRDFTVRPTSSISGYEKSDIDPLQAGHELGVDYVLDGRIKKYGDTLRISLQMLDVNKGSTAWAGQFDEKFSDVLTLEDAISEQVADALVSQVTGENAVKLSKRGTDNPQAYEAYLKGRFYWNQFTADSLPKAIECFQKSVELDPNFALAHVGVADFYVWANIYGLIPSVEADKLAEKSVRKALEIDDQLGEAYTTLGLIEHNHFDWEKGLRLHEKAIELNPNYSHAHEWRSANLIGSGRIAEGIKEIERAESLDPLSLRTKTLVSWTKSQAHDFEGSLAKAEEIIALEPNYPQGHLQRGHVLFKFGRKEEAIASIEKALELMPESDLVKHFYCFVLADGNRLADARKVYDEMRNSPRYVKPMFLGYASVAVGEIDEAFKYFNQAADEFDPWLVWFGVDFKLEAIRGDKRYLELLKRTKNPMFKQFEEKAGEKKSIAVLPLKLFSSPTGSSEDEYLSLGLTDALITRLSNVGRLTVRPTTSVLPFQNQPTGPFSAGRSLQVEYVVDGSIRRVNERVRVSLQLLNVTSRSTVWAENFDEKFTDVLELEDVISERVVKSLLPKLTGEEQRRLEKRGTNNVEAYQAYLRGRFFANQFSDESLLKSIECYQEAIQLDENYALPHVGIADFYVWSAVFGEIPCREAYPKAKAEIERALKIDDSLGEAFAIKAFITLLYDWNWTEAERLIKHALNLNPNFGFAHECYSNLFSTQGTVEQAINEIRNAEELDPLSPRAKLMTSWTFYVTRRFSEAISKANEANNMQENFAQALLHLGNAQINSGDIKEAVKNLRHSAEAWVGGAMPKFMLCFALVADNQPEEARKVLTEIISLSKERHVKPYFLGMAYAAIGEADLAFEWFERSLEARDEWMIWFGVDAKLDELRKDPRYLEILEQTNNPIAAQQIKKAAETPKSIAVLPLKFIGETKKEEAYLSIGLADAMITKLSQIRRIIVRPTSSILKFADYEDALTVGKELEVDNILCGTIRKAGERIRVSAQLLDTKTNAAIWSESFDEKFTDILDLEDVVAEKVATLLIPRLSGEEKENLVKRKVKNVEAYEAYLRGRYHLYSFTPDNFVKAISYFEKAVEIDPNFALVYVALSDVHFTLAGFASHSPSESFPIIEKMAQKAIQLDSKLGEAYANLGMVKCYNFNFAEGEKLLKHGLELSPNQLNGYIWHSVFLTIQGKHEEAIAQARKAYELDPISGFHQYHYVWVLYHNRRFDEALSFIKKSIESIPNFAHGQAVSGWVFRHLNKKAKAIEHSEKAHQISPATNWITANLAATYAKFGDEEKALQLLRKIETDKDQYVSPYCLAQAYLNLGDINKTFELLEKSVEDRDVWFPWIMSDAELDSLRSESRFIKLIGRIRSVTEKTDFSNTQSEKTIAVLPFQFIGEAETGEAYLSVGLADAMITRLSRIKGLTVRPTTSILRFNNQEIELSQTAKELGVRFILNGHLKKFGNRLRITVQLLDALKNSTVWAETIDETLDDVLQLEDSVCYKVLRSLTPHLTGEELSKFEKRGTSNPKAYEFYLKGRYHWHSYTVDGISKALVCYYEAIAEDENFALPYAGVADYYNFLSIFGVMSPEESFPAAKEAAEKAIALDENLAEAYTSLGITAYGYDWDFQKAKKLLERSLQINPNSAETRLWYGYLFGIKGQHEKAIKEFEKAEMLNPQSPSVPVSFALTLRNARQYEKGRQKLYRALELQPNNPTALQGFCWFVNPLKNSEEAEAMCKKAVEVSNRQNLPLYAYSYTLASIGKRDEARKIIEELKERSKTQYVPPIYLVLIHTALGEKDTAFEWLEKCFEVRDFWVIWLPIDPRFDDLKSDKRFGEFCKRIKPFSSHEETIHQSQIPTKIFTAEELKGTKPVEKEESLEEKPTFFYRHRFKFATAAIFFALTFIAYATGILTVDFQDRRIGVETADPANTKRSVAILPFKNETANPENDFLCDGLSDNLISRLQEVSGLQVLPRSTSFKYKTGELPPQKAGEEMQVDMVLVGKLIEKSEKIEITAELIDVKSGKAMWGFKYGRPASELVDLQNQLAGEISNKLKINPQKPISAKNYTENSQAFELYLKGEYHRQKATPEDTKKAVELYKKSLELDPNYALAHQGLALTYRMSPAFGTLPPSEAYPLAKESAMKALSIDSSLGSAYIPLASIKFANDWDFNGAETEYKKAIQLVPNNPEAHYSYGNFLVAMGRFDEAINELRIAQQFDPLSPSIASNIAWALYIAGRFNEAETQIKQVISREPNFPRAYISLGEIYVEQGKFDEAIAMYQKAGQKTDDPINLMAIGHVYAVAGRKAEALKIATDLEAKVLKKEVSPFLPAVVYAGLNDKDKAFYWLERAYQERSNWLTLTKVGHRLKPLHGDPRFDDLLKRIGFDK